MCVVYYTDYDPSSGNIIIESGTEIGCTSIQLMDDAIVEETEMFIISFTTADINVTVNIKDDNSKMSLLIPQYSNLIIQNNLKSLKK